MRVNEYLEELRCVSYIRNLSLNTFLLYELGSVIHVLFVYFRKSEPVRIRFEIVGVNKFIYMSVKFNCS